MFDQRTKRPIVLDGGNEIEAHIINDKLEKVVKFPQTRHGQMWITFEEKLPTHIPPGVYQLEVKSVYPNVRVNTAFEVIEAVNMSAIDMVVSLDKERYDMNEEIIVKVDLDKMTVDDSLIKRTITVFLDKKNVTQDHHLFING